jgi:hypothetical protein
LIHRWTVHSSNIRISVLEAVARDGPWGKLRKFIRRYGQDLFTQPFLNPGHLRAILDRGVDAYLASLEEESDSHEPIRLLDDLDRRISRGQAVKWLRVTVEAIMEDYPEYVDYNSTTTQSDRGEMLYTLLDFLRLKSSYERVAWNLRPLVVAHDVLVRRGRDKAAAIWAEAVAQRNHALAERFLNQFEKLSRRYGMRLRSVGDRLAERFVRPLEIDRLRALVQPACDELRADRVRESFDQLEQQVTRFTEEPTGIGFEVPSWLEALETEVEQVRSRVALEEEVSASFADLPQVRLSLAEARRQIEAWDEEEG